MALRDQPMKINTYPIFSLSDNFFHEKMIYQRSPHKIRGTMICIPVRGVLKAMPVFLNKTIFTQSSISEIFGICTWAQYFDTISEMMIKKDIRYIFIQV